MIKIRIETVPKKCKLLDIFPDSILRHHQICKGKNGVKAVVNVKNHNNEKIIVDEHPCEIALSILNSGAIVTSSEVLKGKAFWTVICDHETFKDENLRTSISSLKLFIRQASMKWKREMG